MGSRNSSYLQVLKLAIDIESILKSGHCEACEASHLCSVSLQSVLKTLEVIILMSLPSCTLKACWMAVISLEINLLL